MSVIEGISEAKYSWGTRQASYAERIFMTFELI